MGLVCCTTSSERKGEKSNMESSFSRPYYSNSSTGKHVADAEILWEMTDELVS